MKVFLLFMIFGFSSNCSPGTNEENLELYREKVLRYLVKERIKKQIYSPEFREKIFFEGWWFAMFQEDNVDRTNAVFQIENTNEKTTCGLYIREQERTHLVINLIECEGPLSRELHGSNIRLRIAELKS